jgi:putative SOS response-associated peptidase YedK
MCGRFRLNGPIKVIRDIQPVLGVPVAFVSDDARELISDRRIHRPYNDVPTIYMDRDRNVRLTAMYWQLIHYWCERFESRYTNFNTRRESLDKKHNRELLSRHRCLVPAHGFFETRKDARGRVYKPREAYEFLAKDGGLMMLGAIYSVWRNPADREDRRPSMSIITMDPNEIVGEVHPRMPFVVPPELFLTWLDRDFTDFESVMGLIRPLDSKELQRVLERR